MNQDAHNHTRLASAANGWARSEPELRAMIAQALRMSGIAVEEQVVCAAGAADLVTARRDAVIEVKLDLTRRHIQTAVGQVLLYRQSINPYARAIVVGYPTDETASLVEWAAAVGVEVLCWNTEDTRLNVELIDQPTQFTLAWNIQSHAQAHGLTSVSKLAIWLQKPRSSLYSLWRGDQINVAVATLELLAKRLGPTPDDWLRPGDWFRWDSNGRLMWQVKVVAEEVGLDATKLAFKSGLYPQQLALFWDGNNGKYGKYVFVDTLARLAAALETVDRPFDFGELFTPRRTVLSQEDT